MFQPRAPPDLTEPINPGALTVAVTVVDILRSADRNIKVCKPSPAASTTPTTAKEATAATPSTYPIQTSSKEVDSADAPAVEERVDDVASRVAPDPAADVDESGFGRDHPLHQVLANQPAKKLLRRLQAPGPLLVRAGFCLFYFCYFCQLLLPLQPHPCRPLQRARWSPIRKLGFRLGGGFVKELEQSENI